MGSDRVGEVCVGDLVANKYRVTRILGMGGMGVVVAATQEPLARTVALKLLRPEIAGEAGSAERVMREARAAASIHSEHVAKVLDIGTLDDGSPFIAMEYLNGEDLNRLLLREGPLDVEVAVDYLMQTCVAVAQAHLRNIVHRDLKPANIFLAKRTGDEPCIKVVDFGVAKHLGSKLQQSLTSASGVVGSPEYMAPEQMRGEKVDARTDLWALGVTLFELLSGEKPFQGGMWPEVCARVLNDEPAQLATLRPDIDDGLSAVVQRVMSKNPDLRYPNVAALACALEPYGSAKSRNCLQRIIQIATSTGSLSAQLPTPDPAAVRSMETPAALPLPVQTGSSSVARSAGLSSAPSASTAAKPLREAGRTDSEEPAPASPSASANGKRSQRPWSKIHPSWPFAIVGGLVWAAWRYLPPPTPTAAVVSEAEPVQRLPRQRHQPLLPLPPRAPDPSPAPQSSPLPPEGKKGSEQPKAVKPLPQQPPQKQPAPEAKSPPSSAPPTQAPNSSKPPALGSPPAEPGRALGFAPLPTTPVVAKPSPLSSMQVGDFAPIPTTPEKR